MVSDRAKIALGFVCFHVWIRLPLDWHDKRAAMWLLGWAGYYAHAPEARQALTGEASSANTRRGG